MIIAVASGKGGTGKTTVATSLAASVADRESGEQGKLLFLDCDVEEPNAALFLKPELDSLQEVGILIPEVDLEKCTYCGRCAEVCVWHAIAVVGQTYNRRSRGTVLPSAAGCEPSSVESASRATLSS